MPPSEEGVCVLPDGRVTVFTLMSLHSAAVDVSQPVRINMGVLLPISWQLAFFWHSGSLKYGRISFKLLI